MNPEKIVSAQVVLAAAGGARPGPRAHITTENIREWLPSAETIARVSAELRNMGFELGEAVGNSISITGPVKLFESVFHSKLHEVGGVQFTDGYELPAGKIPPALRAEIVAVTFTPPPDFGPGAP